MKWQRKSPKRNPGWVMWVGLSLSLPNPTHTIQHHPTSPNISKRPTSNNEPINKKQQIPQTTLLNYGVLTCKILTAQEHRTSQRVEGTRKWRGSYKSICGESAKTSQYQGFFISFSGLYEFHILRYIKREKTFSNLLKKYTKKLRFENWGNIFFDFHTCEDN